MSSCPLHGEILSDIQSKLPLVQPEAISSHCSPMSMNEWSRLKPHHLHHLVPRCIGSIPDWPPGAHISSSDQNHPRFQEWRNRHDMPARGRVFGAMPCPISQKDKQNCVAMSGVALPCLQLELCHCTAKTHWFIVANSISLTMGLLWETSLCHPECFKMMPFFFFASVTTFGESYSKVNHCKNCPEERGDLLHIFYYCLKYLLQYNSPQVQRERVLDFIGGRL